LCAALLDAHKPVNFAGHYVVSIDTCGSGSARVMTTDAISGKVLEEFCVFESYKFHRPELPTGIRYRVNSALFIAHGCFDDYRNPECGVHYYRMTPRGLIQIRFIPFKNYPDP